MNRFRILVIGGGIALVIIVVGIWFAFFRDKSDEESGVSADDTQEKPAIVLDTTIPEEITPLKTEELADEPIVDADPQGEQIRQTARIFVEAWGSQSSTNNYAGFDRATVYATQTMKTSLASERAVLISAKTSAQQIATTVLSMNIEKRDAKSAEVVVSAMRVDTSVKPALSYRQKARVELMLVGDAWLINKAVWNEAKF